MGAMAFELTERIDRHLTEDQIAWLTTVTPSGRPAPRPVWFIWDGTAIIVYSVNDGAKLRHIEANDQVAVHFNSSAEGSDVVVISGRAERVADAPITQMGQTPQWYDDAYGTALRIIPQSAWTIPR
jgi:PPOX class probable F420-dependent enzyme